MQIPTWWSRRTVQAPAPAVWRLLVELDAWPRWGPTVCAARLDDGARVITAGATGAVRSPVGLWLPFTVTDLTEPEPRSGAGSGDRWSWSWSVVGFPATRHEVLSTGPQSCVVALGAPGWAPLYLPVLALGTDRISRLATSEVG